MADCPPAHVAKAAIQAGGHGFTQGVITGVSGGSFDQGFWSAAISSVVSTFVQTGGVKVFGSGDVATVLYGTASGGLSAELTGGNFWQGAATGLVVSALNHVAHRVDLVRASVVEDDKITTSTA